MQFHFLVGLKVAVQNHFEIKVTVGLDWFPLAFHQLRNQPFIP